MYLLTTGRRLLLAGDGQGGRELRETIAAYLHQARGVNCLPDQIIVGAGNEYLEILLSQYSGAGADSFDGGTFRLSAGIPHFFKYGVIRS